MEGSSFLNCSVNKAATEIAALVSTINWNKNILLISVVLKCLIANTNYNVALFNYRQQIQKFEIFSACDSV